MSDPRSAPPDRGSALELHLFAQAVPEPSPRGGEVPRHELARVVVALVVHDGAASALKDGLARLFQAMLVRQAAEVRRSANDAAPRTIDPCLDCARAQALLWRRGGARSVRPQAASAHGDAVRGRQELYHACL